MGEYIRGRPDVPLSLGLGGPDIHTRLEGEKFNGYIIKQFKMSLLNGLNELAAKKAPRFQSPKKRLTIYSISTN